MRTGMYYGMRIHIGDDEYVIARQAAIDFAAATAVALRRSETINILFSGAESQQPFHRALVERNDIEWTRINAFAVDEFHAPGIPASSTVFAQLERDLYCHVQPRSVNRINYEALDPEGEAIRYAKRIQQHPAHISCLGIGISGHLALNEPGQADFSECDVVKCVEISESSKQQLMNDPNFRGLARIPDRGITVTLPTLIAAETILVFVPYGKKASVIRHLLEDATISETLPASILKNRDNVTLYLDDSSFSLACCLPDKG
jgi:glucosamine-6-phosphate deaminase